MSFYFHCVLHSWLSGCPNTHLDDAVHVGDEAVDADLQ